jgi:hypothetical protein
MTGPTGATVATGVAVGLTTGGATGTLLSKTSSSDYDTQWVDPSTGAGLVHINTSTFSAVASHAVESVFSNDYKDYKIIINTSASTTATLRIKMRSGSTDDSTAYFTGGFLVDSAGSANLSVNNQTTGFRINEVYNDATDSQFSNLDIFSPFENRSTGFTGLAGHRYSSVQRVTMLAGNHDTADSFDGFNIITSAGTISGTVKVFGYKE